MHEHRFTRREVCLGDHGVPRGHERLRNRGGVGPHHAGRDTRQRSRVDDDLLGVPPAADDAEHPVTLGELGHAFPDEVDLTCDLEPRNVRRRSGRGRVHSEPLQQVRAVHGRAADAHPHLAA